MAHCKVCSGVAGPKRRICVTCSLLCPKCLTRLKNRSGYCSKCYNDRRRPLRRRLVEEADPQLLAAVQRQRVYSKYSKKIERGTLERQPCTECGWSGKTRIHLPDYPASERFIWLCPTHHKLAKPVGMPAHRPKKDQDI